MASRRVSIARRKLLLTLAKVLVRIRERTRSGWSAARCWAMAPPMETPLMWALEMDRASMIPITSSAIRAVE